MIPILILAAGQSSRMRGADKLLQDVDGEPLLHRQTRLATATGHPVFVALPDATHPRARVIRDLPATLLSVPDAAEGMSGTIRGAVAQLPQAPAFMMVLADLVELDSRDFNAVFAARIANPGYVIWRGATADGKPGHPIIFDASLRARISRLQGDGGGEDIVQPLQDQTYLHRLSGNRARFDLDTPEDWHAWRKSKL